MIIKLITVEKRRNSTMQYTLGAVDREGQLMAATSIHAPVVDFQLNGESESNIAAPVYNYAYIPAFKRYYFIDEWIWLSNGFWRAKFNIDVLATYRTDIVNSEQYVVRAASTYNPYITDTKYPSTGRIQNVVNTLPGPWYTSLTQGAYVLGIVGNNDGSIGGISYYEFTPQQYSSLMSYLFSSVDYLGNITEISEQLQKAIIDPSKYIKTAMWFPMSINQSGTSVNSVKVGWWEIPVDGWRLNEFSTSKEVNILIPKHPQSFGENARGKWLELAPYSAYTLEFWPWGTMPLDSMKLAGFEALNLSYIVDNITGVGTLRVKAGNVVGPEAYSWNESMVFSSVAAVAVPVSLAQISLDFGNVGTQAAVAVSIAGEKIADAFTTDSSKTNHVSTSTHASSSGRTHGGSTGSFDAGLSQRMKVHGVNFEGALTQLGQTVVDGIKSIYNSDVVQNVIEVGKDIGRALLPGFTECAVNGSNGSTACYKLGLRLNGHFATIADEDNEHNGRPLCEKRALSSLTGFVLCQNPSIATNGTSIENNLIESYLGGGIYLE